MSGVGGGSRNLTRVGDVDRMAKSLHVGRDDVLKSISGLPVTKHDIAGAPETFILDSWLAGGSLFVTIHGQFTEGEQIDMASCGIIGSSVLRTSPRPSVIRSVIYPCPSRRRFEVSKSSMSRMF